MSLKKNQKSEMKTSHINADIRFYKIFTMLKINYNCHAHTIIGHNNKNLFENFAVKTVKIKIDMRRNYFVSKYVVFSSMFFLNESG